VRGHRSDRLTPLPVTPRQLDVFPALQALNTAWSAPCRFVVASGLHFPPNVGARDETPPPPNPVAGRLIRAQANFEETFPIAILALLGVVLAGRTSESTALGGWIWLGARIVYLPLYWAGIPVVRTIAWLTGIAGLVLVLKPLLAG